MRKSVTPGDFERKLHLATQTYERHKQQNGFPFETAGDIFAVSRPDGIGQRVAYQALVAVYGREEAAQQLGRLLPEEVVRMQLNVLVPQPTNGEK